MKYIIPTGTGAQAKRGISAFWEKRGRKKWPNGRAYFRRPMATGRRTSTV